MNHFLWDLNYCVGEVMFVLLQWRGERGYVTQGEIIGTEPNSEVFINNTLSNNINLIE